MKIKLISFLYFFSFVCMASTSLNWQEVEVERMTRLRVERSLSSLLKDGEYLVEVDVNVGDPGGPDFRGIDQVGLKVSDIEFDDSKGDYIAFSKIGLEVPVLEKYHKENQKKLIELHKFNEAYDLFKNLESVKIDVFLSDLLEDEVVSRAETIVKSLKFSFADVKPQIQFKKIAMQMPKKKEVPKKKAPEKPKKKVENKKLTLKEILDFISRFGNAIGLITATILFGLFGLWLLRKYFQGLKELKEEKEEENEVDDQEASELENEEDNIEDQDEETNEECIITTPEENFERLRKFVSKHENEAVVMFKRWIHDDETVFNDALKVCVEKFDDEELEKIYSLLSESDRSVWKSRIDGFIEEDKTERVCQFIAEEVMRETVSPQSYDDLELFDTILTLRPQDALSFLQQNSETAPVLLKMLSESFLNRIIEKCTTEELEALIDMGAENLQETDDEVQKLKEKLKVFLSTRYNTSFSKKIISLVNSLDPSKESLVYKLLASRDMVDELEKVAKENFPASLIDHLPKDLMSEMLKNYPVKKLVDYFLSVGEDERRKELVNMYAEEGSTSRDILEMEMDQAQNDEAHMVSIKNASDQHFLSFLEHVRGYLDVNEQAKKSVEPIIKAWIVSFKDQPENTKEVA